MRLRAIVAPVLLAALLGLAVVVVRLALDARTALALGDARRSEGAPAEAIAHYLDAARARFPGNTYADLALDRLLGVAEGEDVATGLPPAEGSAPEVERAALEAFRAAVMATRSSGLVRRSDLARVNQRLAELYAAWELRLPGGAGRGSLPERTQWHLEKLQHVPGPSLVWSLVSLAGLGIWLTAAVLFIVKALTPQMKVNRAPALGAGLAFACGFFLFLLGLVQ